MKRKKPETEPALSEKERVLAKMDEIGGGPDPGVLEASVERNMSCPKCAGHVRAVVKGVEMTAAMSADLDVSVEVYCPKPECGWRARQWRPWTKNRPEEF